MGIHYALVEIALERADGNTSILKKPGFPPKDCGNDEKKIPPYSKIPGAKLRSLFSKSAKILQPMYLL